MRIRHGKYRGWLEHRMVTSKLLEDPGAWCFWPLEDKGNGRTFPYIHDKLTGDIWAFEEHHIDGDTKHNCHENLLLLDERIHAGISFSHRERDEKGKFKDWKNGRWRVMMYQELERQQEKFRAKYRLPPEDEEPDWIEETGDEEVEGTYDDADR